MRELKQGTQLADRYTLVRRLGGDSYTETWLAKDRLTRASVALKIASAAAADRMRAEWQVSIRLMHAHIVRVFEFHAEPELAFFSQQFIDGPDVGFLARRDTHEILGVLAYVVEALAYLHGKGLVHRDIKASNILLDSNGAPYLADFGVACPAGQAGRGGTPVAQSPQSLAGETAAPADDIFALGSLIHELVSGAPLWDTDDLANDIANRSAPPLIASDGKALPPLLGTLVARMLDKDAALRPTAEQIVAELEATGIEKRVASTGGFKPAAVVEEAIEKVASIRPVSNVKETAQQTIAADSGGIKPKTVGIALAGLILLLAGVVFILPKNVSDRPLETDDAAKIVEIDASAMRPDVPIDRSRADQMNVYVDPDVRQRVKGFSVAPTQVLEGDDDITFSENRADYSGLDAEGVARFNAEVTLGELLSGLEVLENRGVRLWAPREHTQARNLYKKGDEAYLERDFEYADELYLGALTAIDPLFVRIEPIFEAALAAGKAAFEAGDRLKAIRQFELAVAVTPTHPEAIEGYARAKNLAAVLGLVEQGVEYEEDLDLDAADRSFRRAIELDPQWPPAREGIERVRLTRLDIEFDSRMSEGFDALAMGDYLAARAAFRVAEKLMPESGEPADGLLQVDQGLRLQDIGTLEQEALSLEQDEHWDAVVKTYEEILKVDSSLSFAARGLEKAQTMSALHGRLDKMIIEPDKLSQPRSMQEATQLVLDITMRQDIGPRLAAQRDDLSRLLKRAVTPLTVPIVSDNVTDVFVYKVGRMGQFMRKELNLRPGTYVVVGSRPGYRDVRLEFRVAPEIEMEPVVVQCEEPI